MRNVPAEAKVDTVAQLLLRLDHNQPHVQNSVPLCFSAHIKETLNYLLHAPLNLNMMLPLRKNLIRFSSHKKPNLKNPANLVLNAQRVSSSQDAYCCALWLLPPLSYSNSTINHVLNTLPLPKKHWVISRMLSQTPHDAFSTQMPYNALSSSHDKLDLKNPVKPLEMRKVPVVATMRTAVRHCYSLVIFYCTSNHQPRLQNQAVCL